MSAGRSAHPEGLPWFAQGDLGEAETAAIERHLAACRRCRAEVEALRSMARSLRASPTSAHVAADRLVAYQEAAHPSPDERRRIEDHLRECPSCASDLDVLRRADGGQRRKPWPYLAAAASVVLVLAAAWQVAGTRVDPRVDPRPVRLVLPPGQRGAEGTPSIPSGRPLAIEAWLPLHADAPAYRVLLRRADAAAKVELEATVTTAPGQGKVHLTLPRGLRPGHHVLSFSEAGAGGREIDARGFDVAAPR